jgi:hypothetical protein
VALEMEFLMVRVVKTSLVRFGRLNLSEPPSNLDKACRLELTLALPPKYEEMSHARGLISTMPVSAIAFSSY